MKFIKGLGCFAILLFTLFLPVNAHAEEGAGFTVTPVLGKGQTDPTAGYFSIKGEKNTSYPVTVAVQNLTENETQDFDVQLVQATTSNNGHIDYTPSSKKMVAGGLSLKDLVEDKKATQKVTVAAGQTKNITFNLKLPQDNIKGTVLGSVYVRKVPHETAKSKGVGVRNAFAMTIPVILSEDFNKKITPKLELTNAQMKSDTGVPKVVGEVSNQAPSMFGQIKVDAWVTEKGKSDKLYQSQSEKYEMAPYSSFEYTIDTNNHLLKPGKYTYHMLMKSGDKSFDMARDFTVDSKNRETVNSKLLEGEKSYTNLWWLIAVGVGISIIIFLVAFGLGKRKGTTDENEDE